jgi:hypothetical protein
MRFFKTHPALAALVAVLLLTLVGGAAYAVVREVWVSIDPDKPPAEIEKDVTSQLEAAGVPASVHAEKRDDGQLQVAIQSSDPTAGSALHFSVGGKVVDSEQRMLQLKIACEGGTSEAPCSPDPAQIQAVQAVAVGSDMLAVLEADYDSNDAFAAAITKVFAAHGFTATVTIGDGGITARVQVKSS